MLRGIRLVRRASRPVRPLDTFRSLARSYTAVPEQEGDYDAIVSGGGIPGTAFACALAASPRAKGQKIALVETAPPRPLSMALSQNVPELRVYAITPGSKRFLESIGVWDRVSGERTHEYTHMQVWDGVGNGFIRFNASEVGINCLGYIVEHSVLHSALFERLHELSQQGRIDILCPSSVKDMRPAETPAGWRELTLDHRPNPVSARLVIGADGGESRIRQLENIPTWGWEYDQHAIVATVQTETENRTAWQRFLKTGPLALLPLRENYSSIVWSTSPAEAKRLVGLSEADFLRELNDALRTPPEVVRGLDIPPIPLLNQPIPFLSTASDIGAGLARTVISASHSVSAFQLPPAITDLPGRKRFIFPLKLRHASSYVGDRVALIGDAAHSVHPLAGQGLNLGLKDAEVLANTVLKGFESGQDIGSPQLLKSYESQRKAANLLMQGSIDAFKRLFSNDNQILAFGRNFGLGLLNLGTPIKNQIARYATGEYF